MRASPAPYARHMNCGLLLELKSARTMLRDISSKPSAVPPPKQHLTTRMTMLGTTATKAPGTTPPAQEDLTATPTAWVSRMVGIVVGIVPVVAIIALTMLTAAHGGGSLAAPPFLAIPRRPLQDHRGLTLLSHQRQPPRPRRPLAITRRSTQMVRMAATHRACPHPRERVLVPNDMKAPCPHRSLHLTLQPLRPLNAAKPPLR